jgi:hypothetical protein
MKPDELKDMLANAHGELLWATERFINQHSDRQSEVLPLPEPRANIYWAATETIEVGVKP